MKPSADSLHSELAGGVGLVTLLFDFLEFEKKQLSGKMKQGFIRNKKWRIDSMEETKHGTTYQNSPFCYLNRIIHI